MACYQFVQNPSCEFFPCHEGISEENFNCLFCYCPLYALGDRCGGCFSYTDQGIKDCSSCCYPHDWKNYEGMMNRMADVLELAKKRGLPLEKP